MRSTLILLSIFVCIAMAAEQQQVNQARPEKPRRPANPFLILQIMPKVIEKLRERFPKKSFDIMFPTLFKEIQSTMQLPQFANVEPQAMPGLIATMVEHIIQRVESNFIGGTQPTTGYTEQVIGYGLEREMEKEPVAVAAVQAAQAVVQNNPAQNPVELKLNNLPDLAFDRDPSRNQPGSKIEFEEEDDLGLEPEKPSMLKEVNLGEYDDKVERK